MKILRKELHPVQLKTAKQERLQNIGVYREWTQIDVAWLLVRRMGKALGQVESSCDGPGDTLFLKFDIRDCFR